MLDSGTDIQPCLNDVRLPPIADICTDDQDACQKRTARDQAQRRTHV